MWHSPLLHYRKPVWFSCHWQLHQLHIHRLCWYQFLSCIDTVLWTGLSRHSYQSAWFQYHKNHDVLLHCILDLKNNYEYFFFIIYCATLKDLATIKKFENIERTELILITVCNVPPKKNYAQYLFWYIEWLRYVASCSEREYFAAMLYADCKLKHHAQPKHIWIF